MFEREVRELSKYSRRKDVLRFLLGLLLIFVVTIIFLFSRINRKTDLMLAQDTQAIPFQDYKLMEYLSTPRDDFSWMILRLNLRARRVNLSHIVLTHIQENAWDHTSTKQFLRSLFEKALLDSNQHEYLLVMDIIHSFLSLVNDKAYNEAIHLIKTYSMVFDNSEKYLSERASFKFSPANRALLTQRIDDEYTRCLLEVSSDQLASIRGTGLDETSYTNAMRQYLVPGFPVNEVFVEQYFLDSFDTKGLQQVMLEYKSIINFLVEFQMIDAVKVDSLNTRFNTRIREFVQSSSSEDSPRVITVVFNSQEGGKPSKAGKSVVHGQSYGPLAIIARDRCVFDGWWTGPIGNGELITGESVVTKDENHVLYAKWIPLHTVKYDSTGGSDVTSVSSVTHGTRIAAPLAPIRNGYEFDGWYRQSSLVNRWDFGKDSVQADTTLYAKWNPLYTGTLEGWMYTHYDRTGLQDIVIGSQIASDLAYSMVLDYGQGNSMLTGDVDNDGDMELVVVSGSKLRILANDGTEELSLSLPKNSRVSMLEDFDGDSVPDLWVNSIDGSLRVFVYNSLGRLLKTFVGNHAGGTDVDMVPIAFTGKKVLMKYGAGYALTPRGMAAFDPKTGSELWYYQLGPAPEWASVADMDGNGLLDISLDLITVNNGANANGTNDSNTYVVVVDETGVKKLSVPTPSPSAGSSRSVFVDLDGDNLSEIVCFKGHNQYYHGQSKILVYNRTGAVMHTFFGPNDSDWRFALGDLEGNGSIEIVASAVNSNKTYVLDSSMQRLHEVSTPGCVQFIADLDADGVKEIVLLDATGLLTIRDKSLTLKHSVKLPAPSAGEGDAIASDVDGDGLLDIICLTDKWYLLQCNY